MTRDKAPVVQVKQMEVEVEVDYGQVYLVDEGCDAYGQFDDVPGHPVGIIRVEKGSALLFVGPQWGPVEFTVAVADRDPGADLDGYEDIVEISYESLSGRLSLQEWGGGRTYPLSPLSAGPGIYRLRYHVRGMDEEIAIEIGDHYFLQIWPEPPRDPTVLKSTSSSVQCWLNPG
ncbi:hypothetical protein [Microbispora bryophytorum]|uniref:Uncharacterized protein n=1 Tax=Microbispora bryophytorum subsp. camponoti TaxID=1677852 RepID=A0ABR8LA64_9ACTN|nr:hypothetical protein [Microbispora camponoti]MBD3147800.1 hypothetical protein [Microbispora camponoti]